MPALLLATLPLQPAIGSDERINVEARDSETEARTGITRLIGDVIITRGPMRVEADHGIVRYEENQLSELELTGEPCVWQDRLEDGTEVSGEASRIDFDIASNSIRFSGNAFVRHPQGDVTGDVLTYNLDTETLSATSTEEESRVRYVIEPGSGRPRQVDPDEDTPDSPEEDEEEEDETGDPDPVDGEDEPANENDNG